MDDDIKALKPYATSVTWRSDNGGSWQQWHDESDPMPDQWEGRPPDEVVHVYTADQIADQLARLLDRLEAAEADARRLDYLNRGATVELVPQGAQVLAFRVSGLHCTVSVSIRAAIDAAMQAKEPPA